MALSPSSVAMLLTPSVVAMSQVYGTLPGHVEANALATINIDPTP